MEKLKGVIYLSLNWKINEYKKLSKDIRYNDFDRGRFYQKALDLESFEKNYKLESGMVLLPVPKNLVNYVNKVIYSKTKVKRSRSKTRIEIENENRDIMEGMDVL